MTTPIHLQTYTGKILDLGRMQVTDVNLIDVAHSLSFLRRFNGHSTRPVSIALHAVCVSRYVEFIDSDYALEALHHDDGEAYVGDMTKFLKHMPGMETYRNLEDDIQDVCYRRFGVRTPPAKGVMSPLVKEADRIMLRFEATWAFPLWRIPDSRYLAMSKSDFQRTAEMIGWKDSLVNLNHETLFIQRHKYLVGE